MADARREPRRLCGLTTSHLRYQIREDTIPRSLSERATSIVFVSSHAVGEKFHFCFCVRTYTSIRYDTLMRLTIYTSKVTVSKLGIICSSQFAEQSLIVLLPLRYFLSVGSHSSRRSWRFHVFESAKFKTKQITL